MGYTTDFSGEVKISPPLNAEEIKYLKAFSESRRVQRKKGPYYVEGPDYQKGSMDFGKMMSPGGAKEIADSDVTDHNKPPAGQPGLWCQWVPKEDGTALVWDEGEKFYESEAWMVYLIEHFLKPGALAKSTLPFLQANHKCNGTIEAQGEESSDRWDLVVKNNVVSVQNYTARKAGKLRRVSA